MARQQGSKRVRAQTKVQRSVENGADNEHDGISDDQIFHRSKKVRWDNGTNESVAGDREDSDDAPQSVRYSKSIRT